MRHPTAKKTRRKPKKETVRQLLEQMSSRMLVCEGHVQVLLDNQSEVKRLCKTVQRRFGDRPGTWVTRGEGRVQIADMTDEHIINAYRMLERNGPVARQASRVARRDRASWAQALIPGPARQLRSRT